MTQEEVTSTAKMLTTPDTEAEEASSEASAEQKQSSRLRGSIIFVVTLWVFLYNVGIKGQSPVTAFFEVLDTISDDLITGTLVTVVVGLGIVAVFSITKLYTQFIANVYSFRILEQLAAQELAHGRFKNFFYRLLRLEDQPLPDRSCPSSVGGIFLSISVLYVSSWVYLFVFSEALFFISWSAGVDLDVTKYPGMLMTLPTIALALPFSARVMAYLRYPYAQDYADFLPGAVFVLLLVMGLGALFESDDQVFFLERVFENRANWSPFLRNCALLAFIPVFFEAVYWLVELAKADAGKTPQ